MEGNCKMLRVLLLTGIANHLIDFTASSPVIANITCNENQFRCNDSLKCFPKHVVCDGTPDCSDSSDENDCEISSCKSPNFFKCKNSRCISSAFVCDGENDCHDFSDENNCKNFTKNFNVNSTCSSSEWTCTDRLCIPKDFVCNGEPDCLDGSDEIIGCSSTTECDGFKCKNGHCILKEWRCDGNDDCRDNSDEENCETEIDPKTCTLDARKFLCSDNTTCISIYKVCDGITNCPDKSDESPLCHADNSTCEKKNCTHMCHQLPTGPECSCPLGYRTIDERHCEDINECEIYGICDQKCRNSAGSYECYCDKEYTLQVDKKTCKMTKEDAIMYFSSKHEIRAYIIEAELYYPIATGLDQVVGVLYDGSHIYWTDIFSEKESIMRADKNGMDRELLVTSGLGSPEDLDVDWITGNIYFTDAERQHVGVCTSDGNHCTVLVNKDINKPRGIVLNPEAGEMYWTDWGKTPEIARSSMDGSKDVAFVSQDIHWPNGLAIDFPNERLYWTDAKSMTLESIRLDGTDRRVILEGVVKHPYAIAVFENRLFWSDWATNSIQSCDKFTGKNHHTLINEKKAYIYGINIYHPSYANKKKNKSNPCLSSFCSDICLINGPNAYTCACPQDKELAGDGHTCRDVGKKQMLIMGVNDMLIHIQHKLLGKHEAIKLPIAVKKVGALAYNSLTSVLYISDLGTGKIISWDLSTDFAKPLNIDNLGEVIAMDYDYAGNNLYWCDALKSSVEVLNLNTMSRKVLLHDLHGESPESIALVPTEGVMFVAFKKPNVRETHIDRMHMDGTSRTHPLEHGLLGPISLMYDADLNRIFLTDAGTGNIESTSVEGDDRHGFRSLLTSPVGITSLKKEIFWVNFNSKHLYWADKLNSDHTTNSKITLDLPENIENIQLISITPRKLGLVNPCQLDNGNCSHLCLISLKSAVCSCPLGMILDMDNRTCTESVTCESDEFHCFKSKLCVKSKSKCDGHKDCEFGEDEELCKVPTTCPHSHFRCNNGDCIRDVLKCDANFDCKDKSDEHNCTNLDRSHQCPRKHFKCDNGLCIHERFVCDGSDDCPSGEDEEDCKVQTCPDTHFRCLSGSCIPKSWECDYEYDCPDFSDEHPDCNSCQSDMFTCTNGKCIDAGFVCDREDDCQDNSDEMSCEYPMEKCGENSFSCTSNSSICVPNSAKCNGTSECPHHEDEQNCSECHVEEFTCDNKRCVPTQWLCDHSDDCGDNSDEAPSLCLHSPNLSFLSGNPTGSGRPSCVDGFHCKNGACVDFALVCNSEHDCFDGSDEGGVCQTSCSGLSNPCEHVCRKTPSGPSCKCRDGYQLQGNGVSCIDINECLQEPPVCSQLCINTLGSYSCDCFEGFILRSDKISCKAEGAAMSMVFTADNQIREKSQMNNSLTLVFGEDSPKITGLDVDTSDGFVYFSIETAGTLHRINSNDKIREYIKDVGRPQKISLDWITNNIYFVNTDFKSKSINICNFNEKICAKLLDIDIHRQVSALTVDPTNKVIFYSLVSWWMFNSPSFIIYKCNLDGSGMEEIVKNTAGFISGLTYDSNKMKLYFVNQHSGQISRINYDGTTKIDLFSNLSRPFGLNFFEDLLFFGTSGGYINKCKLYEPANCENFKLHSYSTELFVIGQKSRQPIEENVCRNHTCSHLCVPTKMNYKCLCEDGKLVKTSENCETKERSSESDGTERRIIHNVHTGTLDDGKSSSSNIVAAVMVPLCLVIFGGTFYYILRKHRNSGNLNISPIRFHNRAYGLLHKEDSQKNILEPGQHEYVNPGSANEDEENQQEDPAFRSWDPSIVNHV